MALDPRSMERLEALGRTLPKKLPLPEPPSGKGLASAGASGPAAKGQTQRPNPQALPPQGQAGVQRNGAGRALDRHRLEEAREPEDMFRALIQASADGSVPPHLLDQLRELEASRRPTSPAPVSPSQAVGARAGMAPEPKSRSLSAGGRLGTERKGGATPSGSKRGGRTTAQARGQANDDQALYTAFAQLLLEDDSTD